MSKYGLLAAAIAATFLSYSPAMAAVQEQTAQQQFDHASDLLISGKWEETIKAFEALEQRLAGNKNAATSLAVARIRRAEALIRLHRDEEAEAALRSSLPFLESDNAALREDRFSARANLAGIAERKLDYGEAVELYRQAEKEAYDLYSRARALSGSVRTAMFYDAEAALADANKPLELIQAERPDDEETRGSIRNLKGRVLLNLGRFEEAREELKLATKELGGLTDRVDGSDLSVRSDNAIAALLAGHDSEARKFLAHTGAGRLDEEFGKGASTPPPVCGADTGLSPEDVAVVEFGVIEDGSVRRATPVYSSKQGDAALAFARAVMTWSWSPEAVEKIPPLFRLLTRVELRCSAATERPSILGLLQNEVTAWSEQIGPVSVKEELSDARRVEPLREELARREANKGKEALALVPILLELSDNAVVTFNDETDLLERAQAIAVASPTPAPVLTYIGLKLAAAKLFETEDWGEREPDLDWLLANPAVRADPRSIAAIKIFQADYLYHYLKKLDRAIILLNEVTNGSLQPLDPFRVGALVRLSSFELAAGDADAARRAFAESGLDAEQCALLDSAPRLKRHRASSRDYPNEALKWGFEGWAWVEYDITADGKTTNIRPIIAYPPFVFSTSARDVLARSEYEQSFRPDNGLGCGGAKTPVQFKMP